MKRSLGATACALLLATARPAAAAPVASSTSTAPASPWTRTPRAAASAETTPAAAPSGRLPLEAEVPAEGLNWSVRVGREPTLRAALGTLGGGTLLLEVRDPAGAVVHRATVTAVEVMNLDAAGRSGIWTFSVRGAPGAGAPPVPGGPVRPPTGPGPASPRPRIRFDIQAIEDRNVYAAEAPAGFGAGSETAPAAPFAGPSGPGTSATTTPPGASVSTTATPAGAAALVASLESEMARARGGRIDQEGWALLMLLRRYLNLPPPAPPGAPTPPR